MAGVLVILHFVTAGKQGDDLGTDESAIVLITVAVYDAVQSKVRFCWGFLLGDFILVVVELEIGTIQSIR